MTEETIYTDENGTMFKYLVSYSHNGETYGFTIWAESRENAEDRLQDIGESGMVMARLEGSQPPLRQGGFPDA
jgi:hypothetical protein